ncbi:hypothetical protein PVAND_013820 [Polypedilum vanderplanki]|uniref:Uncharacterized protein n=1 Tax=Polypedilum vanderplanki TaxID=319348 RepID=A0A9J6CSQ1_POLVA|nr:hypothetical protein PVAND_013820 [Polypedilum vanderplanki]
MAIKINKPIFKTYFFCGNLKKAAIKAGPVNIIVGIIGMILTIGAMCFVGFYNYKCEDEIGCVPKFLQYKYLIVYTALFVYAAFTLISGIIYIDGMKNNDPKKMTLLLISRIFAVIVATAIPFIFDIFHIIFSTLPILLEIYTLLCIFSYYIILKNELKDKNKLKKIDSENSQNT